MLGVTARYHYAYALYLGRVFFLIGKRWRVGAEQSTNLLKPQ